MRKQQDQTIIITKSSLALKQNSFVFVHFFKANVITSLRTKLHMYNFLASNHSKFLKFEKYFVFNSYWYTVPKFWF